MTRKAQIKTSWVVYPPNYTPGDGYHLIRFYKKAWSKACSLGEGASCWQTVRKTRRDGSVRISTGVMYEVVVR